MEKYGELQNRERPDREDKGNIQEEARNVVRAGEKESEEFWTGIGLRQGCPLSPTLFTIYIAEMEKEVGKGQIGEGSNTQREQIENNGIRKRKKQKAETGMEMEREELKVVKELSYLGIVFRRNGNMARHVEERGQVLF